MRRQLWLTVFGLVLITLLGNQRAAFSQADAGQAYQAAKQAYAEGDFTTAQQQATAAAKTDTKNPEVFLLLGKAEYQLGEVEKAMAAWRQTLRLAPEEPYAKKMLLALKGQTTDVDTRLALVRELLDRGLAAPARAEADRILANKLLTDKQRAAASLLKAEAIFTASPNSRADVAAIIISELKTNADAVDLPAANLLLGKIKLQGGTNEQAQGLKLLASIAGAEAPSREKALASLAMARHALNMNRMNPTRETIDALGKWVADNPDRPEVAAVKLEQVRALIELSKREDRVQKDGQLRAIDREIIAALPGTVAGEGFHLTEVSTVLGLIGTKYAGRRAYPAAISALELLKPLQLSPRDRYTIVRTIASHTSAQAIAELTKDAKAGRLTDGPLPKPFQNTLAALAAAQKEAKVGSPLDQKGVTAWSDQLALAKSVKDLPGTPPSADANKLFDTYSRWAFEIALPVVKQAQDDVAKAEAMKLAQSIVSHVASSAKTPDQKAKSLETAITLNASLLAALPKDAVLRPTALSHRWELHRQLAEWEYANNNAEGKDAANAQLSETQKQGLAILAELIADDATAAEAWVGRLQTGLKPWVSGSQYQTAEAAYGTILPSLPKAQQRTVELAIVSLWLKQVDDAHARLTAAGLKIPRELNATHKKALVKLCEMQAQLPSQGEAIRPIQAIWKSIIDRYQTLEYFDIAEAAIKTAAENANENATVLAELELAGLKSHIARQDINRLIAQHGGKKEISITPAFETAIDAYTQFIVDRPGHEQVSVALNGILDTASFFQRHGAHLAAVEIYRDFAPIAAKTPKLTVTNPESPSAAQRVAYSIATTLDTHARRKLADLQKDRKPGDPAPSEISAEFTAAIAAYREYLKQHPKSLLISDANRKILDIGLAYATIGAWQVADGIYESELERQVGLRYPERLKFARAMCLLGPAMPTHAREVLAARPASERDREQSAGDSSEETAAAQPAPNPPPRQTTTRQPQIQMPTGNLPANSSGSFQLGMPAINAGTAVVQSESQRIAEEDAAIAQAIRQQLNRNATQVAMLQDSQMTFQVAVNDVLNNQVDQSLNNEQGQQRGQAVATAPVLSDAEIARLDKAFDDTYVALTAIRTEYPDSSTADQARREILVMVSHWRSLARWEESAALAGRFLKDNPRDGELVEIRLQIARDLLAFATKRVKTQTSKQAMLVEVTKRFANARGALGKIVTDFPDQKSYIQQAQWDIANSYLNRARVVSAFSSTLARGQYVQAARQLEQVADRYHDHPQIGQVPQMLWNIAEELTARGFQDEAIIVWTGVAVRYPTNSLAESALQRIAVAYRDQLDRPIKAAEIFQELNFATGGNNQAMQDAIYAIGVKLKNDQRWVESMHVLETFADTFPKHAQAGQALTMVGQIHQTNEAWEDAIIAYRRVLTEFEEGEFAKTAKWAIAECTINLSQWQEAIDAYREYAKLYPSDAQTATANARIEILKEIASYQDFINGDNKRKSDDAQFQIARIVQERLNNSVKAIIEYRKVQQRWPESHLADDALYKAGTLHLLLGNREKAREALMTVAAEYAASPLADDAFFLIGKSYEDESLKLATVTRAESLQEAKVLAQKQAYTFAQDNIRRNRDFNTAKVSQLKKAGKAMAAENEEGRNAAQAGQYDRAQVLNYARQAFQTVEVLSASQMADRQDKINAALRQAVESYQSASRVAGADKADEALLRMAQIFDEKLKDADAAVATWLEIVAQFSGTSVAEDASWRIAQYYERTKKFDKAIEAYKAFLRNYRRSPKAGDAQAAIAENYEQLGEWIKAMDAYTSYLESFPEGPLAEKARTRINWIKTYIL